jgi:hypothetical protein
MKHKRRGFLATLIGGCLFCASIKKAIADGINLGNPPEISAWMDRQHSTGGNGPDGSFNQPIHCCGHQDAHVIGAHEDRFRKATEEQARSGILYEVEIAGTWYPLYAYQRAHGSSSNDPSDDPNPVGEAVVFYGYNGMMPGGVMIYCFSPWEWQG